MIFFFKLKCAVATDENSFLYGFSHHVSALPQPQPRLESRGEERRGRGEGKRGEEKIKNWQGENLLQQASSPPLRLRPPPRRNKTGNKQKRFVMQKL